MLSSYWMCQQHLLLVFATSYTVVARVIPQRHTVGAGLQRQYSSCWYCPPATVVAGVESPPCVMYNANCMGPAGWSCI
jgi:hypothetical protein